MEVEQVERRILERCLDYYPEGSNERDVIRAISVELAEVMTVQEKHEKQLADVEQKLKHLTDQLSLNGVIP